jgi:hypothetical protein
MKTYQTWSKTKPVEIIEAETGFAARKVFAASTACRCMSAWRG